MNHRGILASLSMSPLSEIINPAKTSQLMLVEDPNTNRVNDFLINKIIPVALYNKWLTFRDTAEKTELQGDPLKLMTIKLKCKSS